MATLYRQIQPSVRARFEMKEARWEDAQRDTMSEIHTDLQACLDAFKSCVTTRFTKIEMLNLGHMREDIDLKKVEVHYLIENHMAATP